ncbi:hypothetical protein DL98DRAFT_606856 [Cadophora sp. DSE1049]|nr:hypothetical protein DL98DRAFT_606856 [Cadophora sp. DSE1049]
MSEVDDGNNAARRDNGTEFNAWRGPGQAAFDFRSDVVTTPTASMLAAIRNTTLFHDVYREDETTNDLETYIASITNHEAALFVVSRTMGNQIALRSHLMQPPYSVLCDYRAHILEWEGGGVASLCGALVKGIIPKNGHHLTLEDIEKHISLFNDVHACPTRVISLENTLDGTILPLEEIRRISAFAREHDVKLHLDGARLWEAVAAGVSNLADYTSCFDSVNLCFSKGLGAPVESMLVGKKSFIQHARRARKNIGGGLRQSGVITAAARVAVTETFEGGLLQNSHCMAKTITTNMVWLDLEEFGIDEEEFNSLGKYQGILLSGGRVVVHYQISDEAVSKLEKVMETVVARTRSNGTVQAKVGHKSYGTTR